MESISAVGTNPGTTIARVKSLQVPSRSRSRLRPSDMSDPRAAISRCSDRLPWVLLDTRSRVGYFRNATAFTSTGRTVEVSFLLVDPPGVSLCFVHCPGLTEDDFNGKPPVISAAGSLVLLRTPFTGNASHEPFDDHFVYRAGTGKPSLDLLPRAGTGKQ